MDYRNAAVPILPVAAQAWEQQIQVVTKEPAWLTELQVFINCLCAEKVS